MISSSRLVFKKFEVEHYEEYKSWFDDPSIKDALYDIDEEWLDYVLNEKGGVEYAVFYEDQLIAVVGVQFPDEDHPFYVMNNLAINPAYFRKGVGTMVLDRLFQMHPIEKSTWWVTYVEEKNRAAQDFFTKNGWSASMDDEDDMIQFTKH